MNRSCSLNSVFPNLFRISEYLEKSTFKFSKFYCTYQIGKQPMLRQACRTVQSCQILCCLHKWNMEDEGSNNRSLAPLDSCICMFLKLFAYWAICMLFYRLLIFFKVNFFKKFFQEYQQVVKHFGSKLFARLSANNTCRQNDH